MGFLFLQHFFVLVLQNWLSFWFYHTFCFLLFFILQHFFVFLFVFSLQKSLFVCFLILHKRCICFFDPKTRCGCFCFDFTTLFCFLFICSYKTNCFVFRF